MNKTYSDTETQKQVEKAGLIPNVPPKKMPVNLTSII
jgi:hypothetical protein